MLTPVEIQSKSFKSGGLGYDKKDVDSYMREVLRNYEELYRTNMEQSDRITVLKDGINYYKSIEKTLRKALVLAEKTAEETRNAAHKEAKQIEKDARLKANILLADAKNELEQIHQKTIKLLQQYEKYKAQFKCLAASQIDLLETDAFCINITNLDAILANPLNDISNEEKDLPDNANRNTAEKEKLSSDIEELKNDDPAVNEAAVSYEDYKLSDFEMEGQEDFDFLDLNE